jgi:hypothetical protein
MCVIIVLNVPGPLPSLRECQIHRIFNLRKIRELKENEGKKEKLANARKTLGKFFGFFRIIRLSQIKKGLPHPL